MNFCVQVLYREASREVAVCGNTKLHVWYYALVVPLTASFTSGTTSFCKRQPNFLAALT